MKITIERKDEEFQRRNAQEQDEFYIGVRTAIFNFVSENYPTLKPKDWKITVQQKTNSPTTGTITPEQAKELLFEATKRGK